MQFTQDGDQNAFEALVLEHSKMVLGICQKILGHTSDADDVAQCTFLALWRAAPKLDTSRPLAPWLFRVATHAALKIRRSIKTQRSYEEKAQYRKGEASLINPLHGRLYDEISKLSDKQLMIKPTRQSLCALSVAISL